MKKGLIEDIKKEVKQDKKDKRIMQRETQAIGSMTTPKILTYLMKRHTDVIIFSIICFAIGLMFGYRIWS